MVTVDHVLVSLSGFRETKLHVMCLRPSWLIRLKKPDFSFVWEVVRMNKWNPVWPPNLSSYVLARAVHHVVVVLTLLEVAESEFDSFFICNLLNTFLENSLRF